MNGQVSMFPQLATADFSPCRKWRYSLTRIWDATDPFVWIMCNPSVANEEKLDPTIRRVARFSRERGAGGFVVLNLFAIVSPDPKVIVKTEDPIGERNDEVIREYVGRGLTIIAGWGRVGGVFKKRVDDVMAMLPDTLQCLGVTSQGHPRHPLYVPAGQPFIPMPRKR